MVMKYEHLSPQLRKMSVKLVKKSSKQKLKKQKDKQKRTKMLKLLQLREREIACALACQAGHFYLQNNLNSPGHLIQKPDLNPFY